jgi:hypothetical protein
MLGGSHMKKIAPRLKVMGIKIIDLSVLGWVSSTTAARFSSKIKGH